MNEQVSKNVRVLHVGNVLLDRPIAGLRTDIPERRREELRDAFSALMKEVDEKDIRVVLFSGNLVDNAYATNDTLVFLAREFSLRPETHFVIAPGPCDCYSEDSIYRSGRFPRNTHIFTEEILSRFDFDELGVSVYGWAFMDKIHRFSPPAHKHVADTRRLNFLCGFCEIDGEDNMICPIRSSEISHFGAYYAALTSEQVHDGFLRVGNTVMAYSGRFDCTSFLHKQTGGANLITASPLKDSFWQLSAVRIPTGKYRYAVETIDVSHLLSAEEAAEKLTECIKEMGYDENTALRVHLRGAVSPEANFDLVENTALYGVYSLEVRDETVPTDGTEYLLRDMSAKGELFRHLYPAMTEGTPESRARAARAFRIGYAALREKDFSRF